MALSLLYGPTLTSIFLMLTGKTITLAIQTFVSKVMSLLFNMVSTFVTFFSSKEQTSFNFMAAVTICRDFGAQEDKVGHCFHFPLFSHLFPTVSILPPSIRWNNGLDKAQAGISTARRNINNLRYADDTTLIAESKEELQSLLMKVKEENEKAGLKLSIQKTKIMASSPITSLQIDVETVETVTDFIVLGSKVTARWWLQPWN